jgi:hypothetical protein
MELVHPDATVVEPMTDEAAVALAHAVNRNRAALLRSRTAVTIAQIAEATDRSPATTRRWITRREQTGRMIVVRHAGELLVPSVQLTDAFDADEQVADVVARLVDFGMGSWAVWDWLHTPNGWLERTPADAIGDGDLDAVHRAVDGLVQ